MQLMFPYNVLEEFEGEAGFDRRKSEMGTFRIFESGLLGKLKCSVTFSGFS